MKPSTHMWWFLALVLTTHCIALYEVHRRQAQHLQDVERANQAALEGDVDMMAGCRTVYISAPRRDQATDL